MESVMKTYKNEYRKYLVERLSYFRLISRFSARELSQRLGMSSGYIAKYESGGVNMPSEMLLDALKIMDVTPDKFFSLHPENYDEDSELLRKYHNLSAENRELIKTLLDRLG